MHHRSPVACGVAFFDSAALGGHRSERKETMAITLLIGAMIFTFVISGVLIAFQSSRDADRSVPYLRNRPTGPRPRSPRRAWDRPN